MEEEEDVMVEVVLVVDRLEPNPTGNEVVEDAVMVVVVVTAILLFILVPLMVSLKLFQLFMSAYLLTLLLIEAC